MRYNPWLLLLVLFFSLPLYLGAQGLNDGLLLHYRLDNNALDFSGNDFHGTVSGALPAADRFGANDAAMQFGDGAIITFPDLPALKPAALPVSLSCWVYFDSIPNGGRAILTTDFEASTYYGITLSLSATNRPVVTAATTAGRRTYTGSTTIVPGSWYHLTAIVEDLDNVRVFVNGCEEIGSFDGPTAALQYSDSGTGTLGRANQGLNAQPNTLYGRLDDLRYWERAITEAESQQLYDMFYTPTITLGADTMICTGETLTLVPITVIPDYTWYDGTIGGEKVIDETGQYSVTATTDDCQMVGDTIEVMVGFCDQCEPVVPSAFSPNNDNTNDQFRVLFNIDKCRLVNFEMLIFNRWGEQVFETRSADEAWDGRYKGNPAPSDVYVYFARYTYDSEQGRIERSVKGDLTLIR